jgi:predicted PurR-regulated permease PerM
LKNLKFVLQSIDKFGGQKMNHRNVVIGVSVLCSVLLIALIYSVVFYTTMLQDKDSTIDSLSDSGSDKDDTITYLQNKIAQKDAEITELNGQISSLQGQIKSIKNITNLQESTVWMNETIIQSARALDFWKFTADYAGYVVVDVQFSTTTKTFVSVLYSSYGVSYGERVTVGVRGNVSFPILPGSVTVEVGNTNSVDGANTTLTVTYHY